MKKFTTRKHALAASLAGAFLPTASLADTLWVGLTNNNLPQQHFIQNPDNNALASPPSVSITGSGYSPVQVITTGSPITGNYGVGFQAPDINLYIPASTVLQNTVFQSSNGFGGYGYLNPNVLDSSGQFLTPGPATYLVFMGSGGTPGSANDARDANLYRGGNGGSITTNVGDLSIENRTKFSLAGTVYQLAADTPASSVVSPDISALYFNSTGGDGGGTFKHYSMDAGNGGTVTVNLNRTDIRITNSDPRSDYAIWSAITASSVGGDAGMCCVYPMNANGTPNPHGTSTVPTSAMTGATYQGVDVQGGDQGSQVTKYGRNGDGSQVSVTLNDVTITGVGNRLVGVSAASLGGARPLPLLLPGSGKWTQEYNGNSSHSTDIWFVDYQDNQVTMTTAGSGGPVDVALINSTIDLSEGTSLAGIYATSGSKPFYLLSNILNLDTDNAPIAGDVTVSVDSASSIKAHGDANNGLSIGVVAAATGGYLSNPWNTSPQSWTFTAQSNFMDGSTTRSNDGTSYTVSTYDIGQGGNVTVTQNGIIEVSSKNAVGIMALSSAGGASATTAQAASWGLHDGANVDVYNTNSISVAGQNAVGIYAASLGSGGLLHDMNTTTTGTNTPVFANGSGDSPINRIIRGDHTSDHGSGHSFLQGSVDAMAINVTPDSADGATVSITNDINAIIRVGNMDGSTLRAYGIVAQSIGTGGGLVFGDGEWFHGSSGGPGGNGGNVNLTNYGLISAITNRNVKSGAYSGAVGFVAQSIGGGGGAGGSSQGFFVAVGGRGGEGGNGGTINIDSSYAGSQLITSGDFAIGALAQSIGGGGGHAGASSALQFLPLLPSVAIGGVGGGGGNGGDVNVTTGGHFTTAGEHAHALVLQSIGGGGGVGGAAHSGSFTAGISSSLGIGGAGGDGGNGGDITATMNAGTQIHSYANDSSGVIMQSIGGGGGLGGTASAKSIAIGLGTFDPELESVPSFALAFAFGGQAGKGGSGGEINLTNYAGKIITHGGRSHGVLAQSIGGGGGSGGDASATSSTVGNASSSLKVNMGLGGTGGSGGAGGKVTLVVNDNLERDVFISTTGNNAMGLFAQSIGAGGGESGVGSGFSLSASMKPDVMFNKVFNGEWGAGAKTNEALSDTDHQAIASMTADPSTTATTDADDILSTRGSVGSTLTGMFTPSSEDPSLRNTTYQPDPSVTKVSAFQCLKKVINTGSISSVTNGAADCGIEKEDEKTSARTLSLTVHVGGNGSAGGAGGDVTSSISNATISTIGSGSHAMFAQSVGGGGGNASTAGAHASGSKINTTITVGGSGGSGNIGGSINLSNNGGRITTGLIYDANDLRNRNPATFTAPVAIGGESHGMFGQSIGGGGGSAGNSDPASSGGNYAWLSDMLSGHYETGWLTAMGVPSDVVTDLKSGQSLLKTIFTPSSFDVSFSPSINVGGSGGTGGNGGTVSITNGGTIHTYGHRSFGVWAQSIGGGGGTGSAASSALIDLAGELNFSEFEFAPSINVGGSGGTGGNGGNITLLTSGSNANSEIITRGYASYGYAAQSIGGGGGAAHEGSTFGLSLDVDPADNAKISTGIDYGHGITSMDYDASASYNSGSTLTPGKIYKAQKQGTVQFGLQTNDTNNANSGAGGNIYLGNSNTPMTGRVETHGDDAMAVFAQTIGGGGGLVTLGCSNSTPASSAHYASACWGNTTVSGSAGQSGQFSSTAAGNGIDVVINAGNNTAASDALGAGSVQVYNNQSITTYGARSMGLVTQTITGGGGFLSAPNGQINSVTLPTQQRVSSAWPGATTLNLNQSAIVTYGAGAWGVFSQMVHSGGGFFGDSSLDLAFNVKTSQTSNPVSNVFAGSTSTPSGTFQSVVNTAILPTTHTLDAWNNQAITVHMNHASILTHGQNAHGMVLQNLGTVGGAWSSSDQNVLNMGVTLHGSNGTGNTPGGKVNVNLTSSTIQTLGAGARALVIQSDGAGPGGDTDQGQITLNLDLNSVLSSAQATTLTLIGGSYSTTTTQQNTINNGGTISNQSYVQAATAAYDNSDAAYNKWAIYAPTGYTNLYNNRNINGNILLGINTRGDFGNNGVWSGSTFIGAYESLHNYGEIYAGGMNSTSGLYIDGSLKHHAGAKIYVDIDSSHSTVRNDLITVTGLARINGEIVPQTQSLLPTTHTLITADTLEFTGSIRDTHIFDWQESVIGHTLSASPQADFTPAGYALTPTQTQLANYLQKHWDAGHQDFAHIFSYAHHYAQGQHGGYQNMLTQLSGKALNSQAIQMKTVFGTTLSDSLSCPNSTAQGVRGQQDNCSWAELAGSIANQSTHSTNSGYHVTSGGLRFGAQKSLSPQWRAGFAVGYASNYLTATGLSSTGQIVNASASLQKDLDAWSFGASLAVAHGSFDNSRTINLPHGTSHVVSTQSSNNQMTMVGLRLRAAYALTQANYYLKPYVDMDLIYANRGGFSETGQTGLALRANAQQQINVALTPMLELGTDYVSDNHTRVRAYIAAGASFLPDNKVTTSMTLASGMAQAGSFDVSTDGPTVLGRLNLGIHLYQHNNLEVRAQYGLQFGQGYLSNNLSANMTYRF